MHQFSIDSKDGTLYNPGIARKVSGTVDPNNPQTLIVETHPIDYKRTITVYIPAQYKPGSAAPFIVTHDGPKVVGKPNMRLPNILNNLIAQGRVPAMIAIMVANGGGDAQGHERGRDCDNMSGMYAEYIETHVLPLVEKNYSVKLTKAPEGRAVMGSNQTSGLKKQFPSSQLVLQMLFEPGVNIIHHWSEPGVAVPATVFAVFVV